MKLNISPIFPKQTSKLSLNPYFFFNVNVNIMILHDSTRFSMILHNSIRISMILHDSLRFSKILKNSAGFFMILYSLTMCMKKKVLLAFLWSDPFYYIKRWFLMVWLLNPYFFLDIKRKLMILLVSSGFSKILKYSAVFPKNLYDSSQFCKILQDSAIPRKFLKDSTIFCMIPQDSALIKYMQEKVSSLVACPWPDPIY